MITALTGEPKLNCKASLGLFGDAKRETSSGHKVADFRRPLPLLLRPRAGVSRKSG